MGNMKYFTEPKRRIEAFAQCDVCVVGGGFAGVAAALAAARNGASVVILEKTCAPGGLGTAGLVVDYLPLCDGKGNQMIGGIAQELMERVCLLDDCSIPACWRDENAGDRRNRYMLTYHPGAMKLAMERLLLEAGVDIFYDTRCCSVIREESQICAVVVENKSGRGAIACRTVIDASGDADVCAMAGEETVTSQENVCAWWHYRLENQQLKLYRRSENFYTPQNAGSLYDGTDHKDVTRLCVDSHRRILEDLQAAPGSIPAILPEIPLFRMTRRLVGRYTLSENDLGIWMEDSIAMMGSWKEAGPRYCIPYAAICGVRISNLLTAGRCISASNVGWDLSRVIPVCVATGEAAGTAAALALSEGITDLRSLPVDILQAQLKRQGAVLDPNLMSQTKETRV